MSKFIEIKPSDDASKKNGWLEHCRQRNMPYVVVEVKGNTASVEWDGISYPIALDTLFTQKEACLKNELQKICDKYQPQKSKTHASASVAKISGLSIEDVKDAANDISDLIEKFVSGQIC